MQDSQGESVTRLASQLQPQEPKQYTETELRAMRRAYVTLRHGTVRACGHKTDLSRQPKLNCDSCWTAWLKSSDGLLVKLHEELVTLGLPYLRATYGHKLVQKFARFLDNELNRKDDIAVHTEEREGSQTEGNSRGIGVGSGEIQSIVRSVEPIGQEASNDEQLDPIGKESVIANQNDQYGVTEP